MFQLQQPYDQAGFQTKAICCQDGLEPSFSSVSLIPNWFADVVKKSDLVPPSVSNLKKTKREVTLGYDQMLRK